MSTVSKADVKVLGLAMLAGLGANGTLAGLTLQEVGFSLFPLFTCVLAFYVMLQEYQQRAIDGDIPLLSAGSFLFGALGYSVLIRVSYPSIGSNFFPLMLCLALLFWLCYRLGLFTPTTKTETESES